VGSPAEQIAPWLAANGQTDAAPAQGLRLSAEPLIPEILDAKAALDRAAEAKASMRGMLDRAAEARVNQPLPAEGKAVATRAIESRAVETKSIETKPIEASPVEVKPTEARPIEARPVVDVRSETKSAEAKPAETTAVETQAADRRIVNGKPIEITRAEPQAGRAEVQDGIPASANVIASEPRVSTLITAADAIGQESLPIAAQPAVANPIEAEPSVADSIREANSIEGVEGKPERTEPAVEIPPAVTERIGTPQFDRIPLLAKLSRLALPKIASSTAKGEPGQIDLGRNEVGKEAPPPSTLEISPGPEPRIEANADAQFDAPDSHPCSQPASDAKAGLTPEAASREPMLPTFAPPPRESLNALLADVGMLDDESTEDGPKDQPDPPTAGKLPLPAISSAALPAVAPEVVSIGAVAPRALPTMAPPAHVLVQQGMVKDEVSPANECEQKIAGLPLVESRFPMARPSAQASKFAAAAPPVPVSPRAGAVRAPRSPAPFLAPDVAGLVKYSPLEKNPIRPVPPPVDLRRSDTAPRITLPGPMLTRALVSFKDRELAPIFLEARAFRKRFAYGWLAIVLAVGTVLGVGFSSMISTPARATAEARSASEGSPGAEANTAGANPAETNAAEPAAITGAPVHTSGSNASSNPLSRIIEVTGLRIVMDPAGKQQVEYLVVNHSSARFPDATIYVTVRAADARVGQAPLCRFSFAAPDLGPFEAKEMTSAIEKTNRTGNLPDWQDLRAEIEIGK